MSLPDKQINQLQQGADNETRFQTAQTKTEAEAEAKAKAEAQANTLGSGPCQLHYLTSEWQ